MPLKDLLTNDESRLFTSYPELYNKELHDITVKELNKIGLTLMSTENHDTNKARYIISVEALRILTIRQISKFN